MVGALLLVEEEALDVQEALLQVVLRVVKGKAAVPGEAQGEEGALDLGLPQADLHPVGGVAEGHLGGGILLEPGEGDRPLGGHAEVAEASLEAKPPPAREGALRTSSPSASAPRSGPEAPCR